MNFTEVTLSYPCILYKAEVSHFTSRKSTAIEWVILEAITKCEKLQNYSGISIANFFEQLFTISDADLLIRPVLISLQDIGAIIISEIDDETDKAENDVFEIAPNLYIVQGIVTLNDFNEYFDVKLESDDVDTIAGY